MWLVPFAVSGGIILSRLLEDALLLLLLLRLLSCGGKADGEYLQLLLGHDGRGGVVRRHRVQRPLLEAVAVMGEAAVVQRMPRRRRGRPGSRDLPATQLHHRGELQPVLVLLAVRRRHRPEVRPVRQGIAAAVGFILVLWMVSKQNL